MVSFSKSYYSNDYCILINLVYFNHNFYIGIFISSQAIFLAGKTYFFKSYY